MNDCVILVTGSAGRIGQAVVKELVARGLRVRGFDLVATASAQESIVGSITDPEAVRRAVAGCSAIIHLAATPDDDDFLACLVPNNIVGVHHLLEAAREVGVSRLVLASSGQVVWWQRHSGPWPIGTEASPTPRGWYACTKVFLEAAGRVYAETAPAPVSVLAVRLGWCPRTSEQVREIAASEWAQDVYLSPADAGRFFACAVAPRREFRFSVVYACSRPARRPLYDLTATRELLGFEPLDTWPVGVELD